MAPRKNNSAITLYGLLVITFLKKGKGEVVEFEREMYSLFTHVTRYIIDITCILTIRMCIYDQ